MTLTAIALGANTSVEIPDSSAREVSIVMHGGSTVTVEASADNGTTKASCMPPGVTNLADSSFILEMKQGVRYWMKNVGATTGNFYVTQS